jgi:hypothetical protein
VQSPPIELRGRRQWRTAQMTYEVLCVGSKMPATSVMAAHGDRTNAGEVLDLGQEGREAK